MSQTRVWMAATCAVTLLAGCASGDQAPRSETNPTRQCFFASSVNSFAPVDSSTVNIRVGANQVFRLDLMSNCGRDVSWTRSTRLVTRGSSSICTGSGIGTTLITAVRPGATSVARSPASRR